MAEKYADSSITTLLKSGVNVINGQVADAVIANQILENIYQGEIETGGRGSTQEFSNNTTAASITVVRPLPLPIKARDLGAKINGGVFSSFKHIPGSDSYELRVITTIDDVVDIPGVSMDMIPLDVAKSYVKNISDKVVLNANALKIAAGLYTSLSAEEEDAKLANVLKYNATKDKFLDKVNRTILALDKGDVENGISMFPHEDRIALVGIDAYADLLSLSGVLNIGGANYGYDILKNGGVDADATPTKLANGFVGTILGVPCHTVAPLIWSLACDYLGFTEGTFDNLLIMVKSATGNLFALAANSGVKTIDSPDGQGIRLQPKYRMGASCIMPKANSMLFAEETFANPYGVKVIFSGKGVEYGYIAPGSRETVVPATAVGTTGKFTAKAVGAVACAWVNKECHDVQEFVKEYNAADSKKGLITTLGTEQTLTGVASGDTVSFLYIASDGTCAIDRKKSV